jgi:hypothetical protein
MIDFPLRILSKLKSGKNVREKPDLVQRYNGCPGITILHQKNILIVCKIL